MNLPLAEVTVVSLVVARFLTERCQLGYLDWSLFSLRD